jgi:hypothetical protein
MTVIKLYVFLTKKELNLLPGNKRLSILMNPATYIHIKMYTSGQYREKDIRERATVHVFLRLQHTKT